MWVIEKADGTMVPIPDDIDDAIFELLRAHAARRLATPVREAGKNRAMHNLRMLIERSLTNAANGDPLDAVPQKPGKRGIAAMAATVERMVNHQDRSS